MKVVFGKPKFDSVFLGEVKVSVLTYPQIYMTVVVGYQESKTGQRFGSLSLDGGWSPATMAKLEAFLMALQDDVAGLVFEDGTIPGGQGAATPTSSGVPEL